MGIYFLYKFARGDFRYWLNVEELLSWLCSIICRLMIKVITDFTLIVQFRHQFELGGVYWLANIVTNQLFCFVSVYLYKRFADTSTSVDNIIRCNTTDAGNTTNTVGCDEGSIESQLLFLVIGLFVLSVLSFGIFSRLINKDYLWTFYDIRTGSQFLCDNWRNGITDIERFETFDNHRTLYKSIEPELKVWLEENWERWEEEKEDWFNAAAISSVPVDLLPKKALSNMGGVTGRKASIIKMKEEKGKVVRERRGSVNLKIIPTG